jgi:uncharacterized protein YkwD
LPKPLPGKRLAALLLVNLILSLAPVSPAAGRAIAVDGPLSSLLTPTFTGCGGSLVAAENADYEQLVVVLTNQERAKYGLPPLKRSAHLDDAARYHAADMLQDQYVEHDTYDRVQGNLVWECSWSSRLANYYSGADYRGENIAWNYPDPQAVVTAWMGSAGHRENILNPNYREIGSGYASAYWVQDFGRRPDVYPVVIDGEADKTNTRQVSLYIYGKDIWTEMRLRNDGGEWGNWQPFQERLVWTLAAGKGMHTVSVELRSGIQTSSSDDSIYLTQDDMFENYSFYFPLTLR